MQLLWCPLATRFPTPTFGVYGESVRLFRITARMVLELDPVLISSDIIAFYKLIENENDAGTESAWDGVEEAVTADVDTVFAIARPACEHVKASSELSETASRGSSFDSVGALWSTIETAAEGLSGMAFTAKNAPNVGAKLNPGDAWRSGLLIHVHDRQVEDAPSRKDAVQRGPVAAEPEAPQAEVGPAP